MKTAAVIESGRRWLVACGAGVCLTGWPGQMLHAVTQETGMPASHGPRAVHFERSGGSFFLVLTGDAMLDAAPPEVRSEASATPRPLTEAERRDFALLDPAALRALPVPLTAPVPDAYQWDVVLDFAGSGTVALRWHTPRAAMPVCPGLGELAGWVEREVEAIWARRIGRGSP